MQYTMHAELTIEIRLGLSISNACDSPFILTS